MVEPLTSATHDLTTLERLLERLCPTDVRSGVATIDALRSAPFIGEEHRIAAALTPRRTAAFRAGRALVRHLANSDAAIGRAANGAPIGPEGRPISIAHDDAIVVALVGPVGGPKLGVDIERWDVDAAVLGDLRTVVYAPGDAVIEPMAMFAIKEAVYKAWSRPDRPVIGFEAASIRIVDDQTIAAVRSGGTTSRFRIDYDQTGPYVVAVAVQT